VAPASIRRRAHPRRADAATKISQQIGLPWCTTTHSPCAPRRSGSYARQTFPAIRRRCRTCHSTEYRTQGRFRVNANHKLLDVWLLALRVQCGQTVKLTVLERVHVRSIEPAMLSGFHDNVPALAAKLLADPQLAHRNDVVLDWADAWTLGR
jgi:Protein of unknown function (DUF1062)